MIATGSQSSAPPIDGLAEVGYWTNREALEATQAPASLVVLGAGRSGWSWPRRTAASAPG